MKHAEKYHFQDFTQTHYRGLLERMMSGYPIRSYTDFSADESFCIIRHDVDFSLDAALAIARIEAEAGAQSTFFLHFHNEWYNLLEARSALLIGQIKDLGHQIGLHFDAHYYEIQSPEPFEQHLANEKEWVEQVFNVTPQVFSFHNPTEYILGFEEHSYQGMLNTYSTYFKTQVGYCSDSNGIWRHARMADFLAAHEHPRIQILTHPGWWTENVDSPKQKIARIIQERGRATMDYYEQLLSAFERPNIDWE
jgi:peptidoglycan/xylan/chitin deacetylase (PgdA/CDA1 family)